MTFAFEISLAVLVAVVIGLTEVGKNIGLPTRYAPLLAIACGIVGTIGLSFFELTATTIIVGIVVGLTACGLYSTHQTTILGK